MKRIFVTLLLIGCATAFAQSTTTSFEVEGIKVILKPTVKNLISVRMYYRGGVTNYPESQAGIENFTLDATTECGTKKYTGNAFKDRADKFGIQINGESTFDYGNIEMECVSKYFDEGWDLFSDAVVNPVFDGNEVELLKQKAIAMVQQEQSDPDNHIRQLLIANAFAGTPYATNPHGNAENIRRFTAQDLKAYYSTILNKNQIFMVVVGKISRQELTEKISATFGAIPAKPYTPYKYTEPQWTDYKVLTEKRELSTNYLSSIMNAPPVTSADYVPYRLGISALSGSLFSELRTNLNLSYDPDAYLEMLQMPFAGMSASTTDPKRAVTAITETLNSAKASRITPEGLTILKNSFITSNYMGQQSSAALTLSLGQAEIMGGWEWAENLPQLVNKVTTDQISDAFNKYIVGLRWAYLGDPGLAADTGDAFKKPVK